MTNSAFLIWLILLFYHPILLFYLYIIPFNGKFPKLCNDKGESLMTVWLDFQSQAWEEHLYIWRFSHWWLERGLFFCWNIEFMSLFWKMMDQSQGYCQFFWGFLFLFLFLSLDILQRFPKRKSSLGTVQVSYYDYAGSPKFWSPHKQNAHVWKWPG